MKYTQAAVQLASKSVIVVQLIQIMYRTSESDKGFASGSAVVTTLTAGLFWVECCCVVNTTVALTLDRKLDLLLVVDRVGGLVVGLVIEVFARTVVSGIAVGVGRHRFTSVHLQH